MPLAPPVIDDRRFAQLVEETLARAQVHTPEWTNFNQSDPGVTLVQLFSFLAENVLYRANLTPERSRTKFLQLLRVPLAPATAARGLVAIANERGEAKVVTLGADLEVAAGAVPFRTQFAMDVLPIEARVFFKRELKNPTAELLDYYRLLYASYETQFPEEVQLYETVALDRKVVTRVDLNQETVDQSLWIALLARDKEDPEEIRKEIGGRTLMLGVVPALDAMSAQLVAGGLAQAGRLLRFELPMVPAGGRVERDGAGRPSPRFRQIEPRTEVDLVTTPGVVQLILPEAAQLGLWLDVDPLEGGVGDMPPALEDGAIASRLITWLRVSADVAARARIEWVGINTVPIRQIERIQAEPLAGGDGRPDQVRRLARVPVIPESVRVVTRTGNDLAVVWSPIDDLAAAAPEVPVSSPRLRPLPPEPNDREHTLEVFEIDAEAGVLRFGDGLRGRRLPLGASVFASYEFCQGAAGVVSAGTITGSPELPSGFTVSNPVQTWGGTDAETVAVGEKQVKRYLQHRDRLVSLDDFQTIACRTPGVQIGRIEVLPAFHPDLSPSEPGSAPGVVTILAIPRFDAGQPDAPRADRLFLNALCRYLDPRRLVTTELVIRGADYKGIWVSVGIDVATGLSVARVVEDVKARVREVLRPFGPEGAQPRNPGLFAPVETVPARGWPLRTAVSARVLLAEVARVNGVTTVSGVRLAEGVKGESESVDMVGLELPRVLGISVVAGEPAPIDELRGNDGGPAAQSRRHFLPVPVVPEACT